MLVNTHKIGRSFWWQSLQERKTQVMSFTLALQLASLHFIGDVLAWISFLLNNFAPGVLISYSVIHVWLCSREFEKQNIPDAPELTKTYYYILRSKVPKRYWSNCGPVSLLYLLKTESKYVSVLSIRSCLGMGSRYVSVKFHCSFGKLAQDNFVRRRRVQLLIENWLWTVVILYSSKVVELSCEGLELGWRGPIQVVFPSLQDLQF